jgi:hypothetical protein
MTALSDEEIDRNNAAAIASASAHDIVDLAIDRALSLKNLDVNMRTILLAFRDILEAV